jgi:hypothetical protein
MKKILDNLFSKEVAIQCQTKEEAEKFIEVCKALNDSNTIDISSWDINKENTCYDINNKEYIVSFADKAHYASYGYKVVSFKSHKEEIDEEKIKAFVVESEEHDGFIIAHSVGEISNAISCMHEGITPESQNEEFGITVSFKEFKKAEYDDLMSREWES